MLQQPEMVLIMVLLVLALLVSNYESRPTK